MTARTVNVGCAAMAFFTEHCSMTRSSGSRYFSGNAAGSSTSSDTSFSVPCSS